MKNTGTNETKFKIKHNSELNPIATKSEDFSDAYAPIWNDEEQRFEESDVRLDRDNGKTNFDSQTQFNDTVILGSDTEQVDLHINGNIIQKGENYETHAEELYTSKDHIILRDGAIAGLLDGEHSGLEILKYDGTNSVHLCIDNTGFAQVGEDPNKDTTNTYTFTDYNLYVDDGKYYDDPKFTIEHEFYIPALATDVTYTEVGTNPDNTVNIQIEYKLTEGSLQRLLTVDKNAQDQSLLYYDNKFHEAKTIELPNDTETPLVPVLQGGRVNYREYTSGKGDGNANNWHGTTEQFDEALAITDEYDDGYIKDKSGLDIFDYEQESWFPVSSKVVLGDMNAVTSDAVYNYSRRISYISSSNVITIAQTTTETTTDWIATDDGFIRIEGSATNGYGAYVYISENPENTKNGIYVYRLYNGLSIVNNTSSNIVSAITVPVYKGQRVRARTVATSGATIGSGSSVTVNFISYK